MDTIEGENRRFESLAWGLLFVWLGVWWGFLENGEILPEGSGAIGVGLILIGLNVARWLKGIPINTFSSAFGALFLILGVARLPGMPRNCPVCDMPAFALFLILIGGIVLGRELLRAREAS